MNKFKEDKATVVAGLESEVVRRAAESVRQRPPRRGLTNTAARLANEGITHGSANGVHESLEKALAVGESEEKMTEFLAQRAKKAGKKTVAALAKEKAAEKARKADLANSGLRAEREAKDRLKKKAEELKDAASTIDVISDDEDALQDYFKERAPGSDESEEDSDTSNSILTENPVKRSRQKSPPGDSAGKNEDRELVELRSKVSRMEAIIARHDAVRQPPMPNYGYMPPHPYYGMPPGHGFGASSASSSGHNVAPHQYYGHWPFHAVNPDSSRAVAPDAKTTSPRASAKPPAMSQ